MNYESPPGEKNPERHEDHIDTVGYGFRGISRFVDRLKETPEELEKILREPASFFERLTETEREKTKESPDGNRAYRESLERLEQALLDSPIVGEGTSNRFRILDREHADGIPEALVGRIGIREMKRAPITDPSTGSRYLGIPVNPDQPDPVHAFRHGVMVQAVGSGIKGALPEIYRYSERRGAIDMDTGRPIPGLENETVGMNAVMEVLNGPAIAKIIDREGVFWQRRYSARSPESLTDFLQSDEYREYVRYSVEEAVKRWPGLLDIDWNGLDSLFESKIGFMNGLSGGASLVHRDLHFGNSAILFDDERGRRPDRRIIGFLDFDLSALSTRADFGRRPEDYLDPAKSNSLREQFHMPDLMPKDSERMHGIGSIIRLDAVTHHRIIFGIIGETIREIREKQ